MNQQHPFSIVKAESDNEFEHVFEIRRAVFGGEQQVPEDIDLDGHDAEAHHFLLMHGDTPAGTARWRITAGGMVKLERFAILPPYRGMGAGALLVKTVLAQVPRFTEIYLNAQEQVIPFYEKLGFVGVGDYFSEANIRHRKMVYPY
jgi:predicted GNAT family N-acyltransferase